MALNFSANQYEKEFHPTRLQNWEVPKRHRDPVPPKLIHLPDIDAERPRTLEGFTQIIANDRGHLNSGISRSSESPWGTFVGTWDRKCHLPGNNIMNPTARARSELRRSTEEADIPIRTPILSPKADSVKKAESAERSPCSGRSGAKTPDLRSKECPMMSPIPTPGRDAVITPTMDQVTARMNADKCTSPKPVTPPPERCTPPPPQSAGYASSRYPPHHHFTYYDGAMETNRSHQPENLC